MKNSSYVDLSSIFDDIFDAAQTVGEEIKKGLDQYNQTYGNGQGATGPRPGDDRPGRPDPGAPPHFRGDSPFGRRGPCGPAFQARWGGYDEHTDYYPAYNFPPMNVYMKGDRSMVFEFALAGFDEKDISLSFQGDYMVFSAKLPKEAPAEGSTEEPAREEDTHYFKRRLKMRDIEKQKYYVPLDKYEQEAVKAVYKNGILKVTVPPKEEPDMNDGVKIEILKEGN